MKVIMLLAKILIAVWGKSTCPGSYMLGYSCKVCKYDNFCTKIDELSKVVEKYE